MEMWSNAILVPISWMGCCYSPSDNSSSEGGSGDVPIHTSA